MILGFRGSLIATTVSDSGDLPVSALNLEIVEFKALGEALEKELCDKSISVIDTSECYNGVDSFIDLDEIFCKYQRVVTEQEGVNPYDFTNYFNVTALITERVNSHYIKAMPTLQGIDVKDVPETRYQAALRVLSTVGRTGSKGLNILLESSADPDDITIRNWVAVLSSRDAVSKISNFVELREAVHRILNAGVWLQQVNPVNLLYQKGLGCLRFFYVTGFIMPNIFLGFALYDKGPRYVMLHLPNDWRIQRYECFNSKKVQNDINIGDIYFVLSETDTYHDCDLVRLACRNKVLSFTGLRGDNLRYGVVKALLQAIDALLQSSGGSSSNYLDLI